MLIELTPEQSAQLDGSRTPPIFCDPRSKKRYILMLEQEYVDLVTANADIDNNPEQRALRRAAARGAASRLLSKDE